LKRKVSKGVAYSRVIELLYSTEQYPLDKVLLQIIKEDLIGKTNLSLLAGLTINMPKLQLVLKWLLLLL
jgi:hypothetical protein